MTDNKKNRKVVALIQARMGSTRLPGKMLAPLLDKPLITWVIERAKKAKLVDAVVLATSQEEKNKVLINAARKSGIECFAGSENDVLDRFYQCAKKFKARNIVRITGDCPLIDPQIIDEVITLFKDNELDYACNVLPPTYPDGFDVEVFSFKSLERAWKEAKLPSEREHVTPYIWKNQDLFKRMTLKNNEDLSKIRLTVDEKEDLVVVENILKKIGFDDFRLADVVRVIKDNPRLLEPNNKFKRNEGYEKSLKEDKMAINNFSENAKWLREAKKIIPSAAQTYSKSYKYFSEGAGPAFLEKGKGSHVWDIDGNEYIDFVCGLGAITLGYNNKEVNEAINEQLKKGISFSQSNILEIKLAKKLIEIIPCAEMVKFVKNGSDATTAAIRLARAYTSKDKVALCGYHGYHDWSIGSTENDLGVPKAVKELTLKFNYNDIASLKQVFEKNKDSIAAVILEPCQDAGPEDNFLEKVRELTHKNGAVLIFDEVVSGFRMGIGGAQSYFKVTPDLAAFGKGIGNGLAISAVVGKKKIMQLIDKGAFVSTTFGGETLSLAGALATIKQLEAPKAFEHIFAMGNLWLEETKKLIKKHGLSNVVKIYGLSPHCGVVFKSKGNLTNHDLFSVYQEALIREGILSLGVNNFCSALTKDDVYKFVKAVDLAFGKIKETLHKGSVEGILRGKKFRPIFKRN
jgi:glutamate-1-semialdehyde 2,1-aminomutase/spore coat polysaccharide biosynthesis protein SpsF